MKRIFWLFVSFISCNFSHAGTKVLTANEDDSISRLFSKYCSGSADRGVDGNILWVCKRAQRQTPFVESYLHIFEALPLVPPKKQVIFLENPPNQFTHMVLVQGEVIAAPKTNIYVLPGRDTHTLAVKNDIKANFTAKKPSIFFTRGDFTENSQGSTYTAENDDKEINAVTAFEYTKKPPQPPLYVRRRQTKIIREKRNHAKETDRSQSLFHEEAAKINKNEKAVTLHYRRKNPARFGYNRQEQSRRDEDNEEEYVSAPSSYYINPYHHLRPVYVRPQI